MSTLYLYDVKDRVPHLPFAQLIEAKEEYLCSLHD